MDHLTKILIIQVEHWKWKLHFYDPKMNAFEIMYNERLIMIG